jgi:hypothetical protein
VNVNLNQFRKQDAGETPTLMNVLRESAEVLSVHKDTKPIGPPVLVPDVQTSYPGAYQVWYPVEKGWIYIDAEGVIQTSESIAPRDELWAWRSAW